jgi:hypothetical protein
MDSMQRLIAAVKEKRSLAGVSDSVIKTELENYFRSQRISLSNLSLKDEKIIVKDVRQKLRRLTGSFQHSEKSQDDPLLSHSSTKERIPFYPELKVRIAALNVKSILDLGCGLNPLAIATSNMEYHAYDINEHDLAAVHAFFEKEGIKGATKVYDLRNPKEKLPEVDLCMILKVLDVIDIKDHKPSEALIRKINAKHLLISFSTKTLSGAPMRHPQRGWIEHLLKRLGFQFETFSSKNEIFYLASKESTHTSLN